MSDPFIGEIRIVGFNFAPPGWAHCDGQVLPISQNTALFSLLGNTYGGDGLTTFALPDFRNRSPIHHGQGPGLSQRMLGESGGESAVALTPAEMPPHTHQARATATVGNFPDPGGKVWASIAPENRCFAYNPTTPPFSPTPMSANALSIAGQSQLHNNRQPFLGLNFIIAVQGIFPPRP